MNKRTTLKDIAELAEVSRGTVDRVLNNRGRVDPDKKKRILQIAEQLGYRKNMVARNLSLNQTKVVQVLMPTHEHDQYWGMVYKGILSDGMAMSQFNVKTSFLYYDIYSKDDYRQQLKMALESAPDFLLLAPVFKQETLDILDRYHDPSIKIFTINSEIEHDSISCFLGQNSFTAGVIAGKLFHKMVAKRERKILCLTLGHPKENAIHIQKKLEGIRHFNDQSGETLELISMSIEDFHDEQKMQEHCKKIESTYPDLDGIFLMNSRAKFFIRNFKRSSLKGKEVLVIGFDLTEDNIDLLKEDKIDCLLNERPFEQGRKSMEFIFNHLVHSRTIPEKHYLPIDIVIKENYFLYV